jgi:sugar phosphate isomerase/epimerase
MLLSISTSPANEYLNYKEAIRIIYEAGFDAFDLSLCEMTRHCEEVNPDNIFNGDDYIEQARALRRFADELGIVCNQAHAPFHSSTGNPETDKILYDLIVRSMEIASIVGAKIIVVHPKQHLLYGDNKEELFKMNVEFYNSLIPYCEKYNIKVAVENMFQGNSASGTIVDSTCASVWEFNKYLDTIDSEWIVGCLDLGHVSLVRSDVSGFIRNMGNKRLQALHVHDTDFKSDGHTIPFCEKMDYEDIAKTLGEIDYKGDFTYEVNKFFFHKPIELLPAAHKYACEVGRYLIAKVEKNRK